MMPNKISSNKLFICDDFRRASMLLCRLGVTANYSGFYYTVYAASLACEDPLRLQLVTKWLYPDVAKKYNTDADHVRKNIAKISTIAWEKNPALLSEMAMCELKKKPGTAEFLAIFALFLINNPQDDPDAISMLSL